MTPIDVDVAGHSAEGNRYEGIQGRSEETIGGSEEEEGQEENGWRLGWRLTRT